MNPPVRYLPHLPPHESQREKVFPQLNSEIARRFEEVAHLLNEQQANPYRVQAYRHAAQTLCELEQPVTDIFQQHGLEGLRQLPGIGESLARTPEHIPLIAVK